MCHPTLKAALLLLAFLQAPRAAADEEGFEPLFAGDDLSGWVAEGEPGFTLRDGVVVCDGSGDYPTWLRSEEVFENFVLRFEFRLGLYGEGGVFLHAPLHGRNSKVGFEVQLSDDSRNPGPVVISTGAIYGAVAPLKENCRPLGEWNEVEVLMDWPTLRVTLNGEVVQDLNVDEHESLRHRLRSGYLGLQDRGKRHAIRNLRIKRLPSTETWKPLFNGRNFDGWAIVQPEGARWSVSDGVITAEDGNGYLVTESEYENYELQTYVQTSWLSNGGIFCRWKSLVPKDRGFEIQIEDIADSNNPTGSIYDLAYAQPLPIQPGEWYLMQLILEGPECIVRVNGETVARTDALPVERAGHIALQMHRRNSWIRFKGLRLKEID